jgi:hypothetical protein
MTTDPALSLVDAKTARTYRQTLRRLVLEFA